MENKKNFKEFIVSTVDSVKSMLDVTEIIGNPIKLSEKEIVIPIFRLTFGFGIGGSDIKGPYSKNNLLFEYSVDSPLAGGGLGGLAINPEAFLYIKNGNAQVVRMKENKTVYDRIFEVYKDVSNYFKDKKCK